MNESLLSPSAMEVAGAPLAERMRPRSLDEFVGQSQLLGEGRILRGLFEQKAARSFILCGPPGTGKTTLARLYAAQVGAIFHPLSAVMAGVRDIREAADGARLRGAMEGRRTLLFIDEIHRLNKGQQDALLPLVESGVVVLVGATTENPSHTVNNALLSRAQPIFLVPLDDASIARLVRRAHADGERGLGARSQALTDAAVDALVRAAQGDARAALNTLEVASDLAAAGAAPGTPGTIDAAQVDEARQKRTLLYDRAGDGHYQLVSAFIKSMRGSDPDAALYYMVRMVEAGEDPEFVFRRILIFASEDVGNADPNALSVAVASWQAFLAMGLPEGTLPMTQAVTYLACAPKSNSVIMAYGKARRDVLANPNLPIPKKLVNATDARMKQQGFGVHYRYPHNFDGHYVPERYLPDRVAGHVYYEPSDQGEERAIGARLAEWRRRSGGE